MLLSFSKISIKDFMNFSGFKMSLENFAKSVGVSNSSKLCYPYELYESVEQIKNTKFFPSYEDFQNTLYLPTDTNIHTMNKIIAEKISSGVWKDFIDVLANFDLVRASCEPFWCPRTQKFLIRRVLKSL